MARKLTGTSRVQMAPFTISWHDQGRCILAYARQGPMAIVAAVPVPDVPHGVPSLWDVAARHLPTNILDQDESYGRWLMCSGWGLSVMPGPTDLELAGEAWTVEVSKSVTLKVPCYGSDGVHIGLLTFDDAAVTEKAQSLLAVSA
jgi:hypothetical protein